MRAIVNVNESWGIGKDGELLTYLPEDMKFFRTATKNAVVILGRKTLESFPGGRPLKGRLNIVLSRDPEGVILSVRRALAQSGGEAEGKETETETDREKASNGAEGAAALEDKILRLDEAGTRLLALQSPLEVRALDPELLRDAFVIGGAEIYREFLPDCEECLVTINDSRRKADAFFPNLDALSDWRLVQESERKEQEGVHYRFTTYRKNVGKA